MLSRLFQARTLALLAMVVLLAGVLAACGGAPAAAPAEEAAPAEDAAADSGGDAAMDAAPEAPALAEMVAAGDLPPLDERLPVTPLVVEPVDSIGQYGGTWRAGLRGVRPRRCSGGVRGGSAAAWCPGVVVRRGCSAAGGASRARRLQRDSRRSAARVGRRVFGWPCLHSPHHRFPPWPHASAS